MGSHRDERFVPHTADDSAIELTAALAEVSRSIFIIDPIVD